MASVCAQIPPASCKPKRAFTLIELLVVIGLIAILASLALSSLHGARERSAVARARSELFMLAQGLEKYRRTFGDYPQTGQFPQANIATASVLPADSAQVRWFNALTGVFGPTAFSTHDRLDAKPCIDVSRLTLEREPSADFLQARGDPPMKMEETNALIDPWGRRYLYFYKSAIQPNAWQTRGYILCSAGPDGRVVAPDTLTGVMSEAAQRDSANADNLWANGASRP